MRVALAGILALCLAALPAPAAGARDAARSPALRVGAAAVALEADDSMVIAGGIGPGKATGQEGELRATAVVVGRGPSERVALVSCDVLFVTRDFVDRALNRIEKQTGIPPANVLVSATHTHHAPSTAVIHGYGRDEVFTKRLEDAIVKAVCEADAKLATGGDAEFLFHLGEEKTVGRNSRLMLRDNTIYWVGPMTTRSG